MSRDDDLANFESGTKKLVVRVRDIFDDCKDFNPRWLPGLLLQEMHDRDLISDKVHERWRDDLGL